MSSAQAFADLSEWHTIEQLQGFLMHPHGRMPPLVLSRQEVADLAACIASLADAPR